MAKITEKGAATARKAYQKPAWQKQAMFERFAVTCIKHPLPAQGCAPPRSNT